MSTDSSGKELTDEEQHAAFGKGLSDWCGLLIANFRSSLDLVAAEAELAAISFTGIQLLMLVAAGLLLSTWLALCGIVGYLFITVWHIPVTYFLFGFSVLNLILFVCCLLLSKMLVRHVGFPMTREYFFCRDTGS